MSTRHTTRRGEQGLAGSSWLLALAVVVAAAAGGAWWLLSPSGSEAHAGSGPALAMAEGGDRRLPAATLRAADDVGFPLVTSAPMALEPPTPTGRFGPTVSVAGRTAALEVQVTEGGIGGIATLRVLAGADEGLVLHTDAEGSLRAEELFPGRVRLSVTTATGSACEREVLLRHRRTATLALDFGDHGSVSGRVYDEHGAPLMGARVELDGGQDVTDVEGRYAVRRSVSGRSAMTVTHAGHARQRRFVGAESGAPSGAAHSELDLALQPAARLAVSVPAGAGLVGDVTLVLVPEGDPAAFGGGLLQPTFPWGELQPLSVPVSGRRVFDDLPACRVSVLAFHPLARSRPVSGWCRPGVEAELSLEWEPFDALEVTVVRGDEPAPGCRVTLTAANPASERLIALGAHRTAADRTPLPLLPHTRQVTTTDRDGQALLGLAAREAWIEVTDEAGRLSIVRAVSATDDALRVDLWHPDA